MIGSFSTKFGKRVEETHKAITRETYLGVLQDAGIEANEDVYKRQAQRLHQLLQPSVHPDIDNGIFPDGGLWLGEAFVPDRCV